MMTRFLFVALAAAVIVVVAVKAEGARLRRVLSPESNCPGCRALSEFDVIDMDVYERDFRSTS